MKLLPIHQSARSHYEALGLCSDASQDAIKQAWRRIAAQHHPDKNGGVASKRFTEAKAAYDILSNPKLRAEYDEFGSVLSGTSIDREAFGIISQMLAQAIADPNPDVEILAKMKHAVTVGFTQIPGESAQLKEEEKRLKKMQDNLEKYWKGTPHIKETALNMIAEKLGQNLKLREGLVNKRKIFTRVQEILADASYELPKPEPAQVVTFITYGSVTTGSNSIYYRT